MCYIYIYFNIARVCFVRIKYAFVLVELGDLGFARFSCCIHLRHLEASVTDTRYKELFLTSVYMRI